MKKGLHMIKTKPVKAENLINHRLNKGLMNSFIASKFTAMEINSDTIKEKNPLFGNEIVKYLKLYKLDEKLYVRYRFSNLYLLKKGES